MEGGMGVVALRSLIQRLLRAYSSVVHRAPTSAAMLAEFSGMLTRDGRRQDIARCLELVLARCLNRTIVVLAAEEHQGVVERGALVDGAWTVKRADIAAWLRMWPESDTAFLRLRQVFGRNAVAAAKRIAMLVPILSPSGSCVAVLVIGRTRVRPLTDSECMLVAAAVGMTTLLLEQVRLRDSLHLAEALGETVEQLSGNRRRRHIFSSN
jgi:K+-sensing histidine kinase KdpD